ncbi:hypothetical protein DWG18_14985 [Lysobacter sp. TY2-98]|uniref:hypothetical protein n=1 Tax=Lysobacter sp. TY2-98 TaxID=2290922 RepID=UPI000E20520C|nr:hypothetical protein [Lysobacter sp. TY2-98]AXK73454.1 hypothetical protein DWG18_14985 [Lysobacter sp. TY2-98]
MHRLRVFPPVVVLLLAGCGGATSPDPNAAAKLKAQQDAAASADLGRQLDSQLSAQNWTLARATCDVLAFRFPQSDEAKHFATQCADAKSKAGEQAESARLKGLWTYQTTPVGKGKQLNASVYSKNAIDTGAAQTHVRLIFRDHPSWGRSSYLVLENGDFDCYSGCTLKMKVDGKPRTMAGSRPKTDEAIAMFIKDQRALWRTVRSAKTIEITVPLKGAAPQTAVFEVGGLDPSSMPGW